MRDTGMLRALVRSFYDAQKLRIMAGNRLVANVQVRLGQDPGRPREEMSEEAQGLLRALCADAARVADGLSLREVKAIVREMAVQGGIIADVFEFQLTRHYRRLLESEGSLERSLGEAVADYPIYQQFLSSVRGCGPIMSAVIVSELDPTKARHVSSFWKYVGLDVAVDGRGRSRRAEHLVDVRYKNSDGEDAVRKGITFNPFLKTKLVGVLAGSFLRCGSSYREYYDNYKHRLESHAVYKDVTKGHRHSMAMRYMIKMFLAALWVKWRELEGLPVTESYAEAKLGYRHGVVS